MKNKTIKSILAILAIASMAVGLTGCEDGKETAQQKTQRTTEEYSEAAIADVPYPKEEMIAGGWLERRNVRERLVRFADPNKISYIYLFTDQGQLMSHYTIKGKVSHVASQLTTSETVSDYCGTGECKIATEAPMDDGTWGPSEDAIFFFTTDGVMQQWNGLYQLADAPLGLTSTPILVYNESSKPTSVGDEKMYGGG